ncbi:NADPH:quinone reductase-like Zn-dependent oxidoreductase [Granulicella aggregans]|uniref:NADPH:quinone reductase-like Zn-dependent oxidoreductase n=1 Tax=Granulicella aggregans TaxID=474949 RepID=A0A7W8E4C1_9BACT|nr:NADP-dependent oxidoreductase [Granulicella aggregans]MBB5058144.1 NADPH:quinone reductase-like Zn-dependent oxidoreductase [Granulicella aggregans]
MKAVVLHEYGGPSKLKYEDFEDPKPGPGEVLVRVAATSVNPVDYKMRTGAAKERFPVNFPGILGRDVSGLVREVGEGVTGFAPAQRVMALAHATYAELTVVKADELTLVPEGLDLVEAAALPLVSLTGEQLISRGTGIKQGETVLISGAMGSVGRAAIFTAKKAGATVIAGVKKAQLDAAKELSADEVVALDDKEAMSKVGFMDAVADTVGGETGEMLLSKVKQGGVFASVVGPPPGAKLHPTVKIVPVMAVPDPAKLGEMAAEVVAGRYKIPIDRMLPLAEAADGQIAAEKGGIGKVLLLT